MAKDINEKWTGLPGADPNTLPQAVDDRLGGISEDATVGNPYVIAVADLFANDRGGAAKTLYSVESTSGANVTISADGTSILYDANGRFDHLAAGATATDTFDYTIRMANGALSTAQVTLTIGGVNDAPVAVGDSFSTDEDAPLTVAAAEGVLRNDSDVEGSPLTAVLVAGPAHGSLTLDPDGSFTYTPAADYNGADSFTYKASDGAAESEPVTVTLQVDPVDEASRMTNITHGGNGDSIRPSISADGSKVVFYSDATNLVDGQTDTLGKGDVFVYDAATGTTTNITHGGDAPSFGPSISADGSTVAFSSRASNLVDGQNGGYDLGEDIFVYDVATGTTTNITHGGSTQDGGRADSSAPSISADGSKVAFYSEATNLVDGQTDANGSTWDIFVYDGATGTTTNVTHGGGGDSYVPTVSADGSTVAFQSKASNLVDGQTDANGSTLDIFVYDVATGTTTNITHGGDGNSFQPSISADGSTIAFHSDATNLVDGQTDANGSIMDIFVYDIATGTTTNVTHGGDWHSRDPSISADGSTVGFQSIASNLVDGQTDANGSMADIFVYDVATGTTTNVTHGADRGSSEPSISADGSTVAFHSLAINLVDGQTDTYTHDIFLYDMA